MIVLEKARPIPTYAAAVAGRPSASERRKPPAAVRATCAAADDERDRAEPPHDVQVELQPDHEQEEGDAELGEERQLASRPDEVGRARPDDDAHHDVRDHERQAQPGCERTGRCGDQEDRGDPDEHVVGDVHRGERPGVHGGPSISATDARGLR